MPEVTQILNAIDQGDPHAADQLLPLVYDELRRLAAAKLANEKPGQTLDATALVHEAYMRLIGGERRGVSPPDFANSRHFVAAAAEAMRRILVENARRKLSQKRGGGRLRATFHDAEHPAPEAPEEILAVNEALDELAGEEPQAAELVKLRYFMGLSIPEASQSIAISSRSADRLWAFARAWLRRRIDEG